MYEKAAIFIRFRRLLRAFSIAAYPATRTDLFGSVREILVLSAP